MLPDGIAASGFPAVEATCRRLGLVFDAWQADLNRCLLAKNGRGRYAADTAVLSIPRQVGKTWDIGAVVFALCVITPGTTVVWTAHRFKVARETFNALRALALSPALGPHIDPDDVYTAAGNESIRFRNGSRIVFAARERGAVRGFSLVDVLVLDEGQILTENALSDLVPTTNQATNPLIVVMGTPPRPVDPGEVFARLRSEALGGESEGLLYVEFSAEPGSDPDAPETWRAANPSYPKRTPAKAIQRLRKLLSAEDFGREALGVWDADGAMGPFSAGAWMRCGTDAEPPEVCALGLALDIDRVWLSLGAVGVGQDLPYLGAVHRVRLDTGREDMLDQAERIAYEHDVPVVVDAKGPAATLVDELEDRGVRVVRCGLDDVVAACAALFDAVEAGQVRHGSHPELNAAVNAAGWRRVGDRRVWSRRRGDVSMLEACTLAYGAGVVVRESVYEDRGLLTL